MYFLSSRARFSTFLLMQQIISQFGDQQSDSCIRTPRMMLLMYTILLYMARLAVFQYGIVTTDFVDSQFCIMINIHTVI